MICSFTCEWMEMSPIDIKVCLLPMCRLKGPMEVKMVSMVLLLMRPPGNTVNRKNKSNVKVAGSWWGPPHIVQLYVCQSVMLIGFIYCCWFHGMIDEGVSVSYCCQTAEI